MTLKPHGGVGHVSAAGRGAIRRSPNEALAAGYQALRDARPIVLVREQENADVPRSAMVIPADTATAEAIAFMVRYTSGYFCVALGPAAAARLGLPRLASQWPEGAQLDAAVSVDAAEGISTGISARDRARTIALLGRASTQSTDLHRPGHVVPVVARLDDGQRRRGEGRGESRGQRDELPYAARRLVAEATGSSAAAYAELVSEWSPAGLPSLLELQHFCDEHEIPLLGADPGRLSDRGHPGLRVGFTRRSADEDRHRAKRGQRRAG